MWLLWYNRYITLIVAVHHNGNADGTRADAPAVLVHVLAHAALILEEDLEHLREVCAEIVARRALTPAPAARYVHLHCRRHIRTRELLVLRLTSASHRNRKQLLEHARVQLQDFEHLNESYTNIWLNCNVFTLYGLFAFAQYELCITEIATNLPKS